VLDVAVPAENPLEGVVAAPAEEPAGLFAVVEHSKVGFVAGVLRSALHAFVPPARRTKR
jgi:hypothetical protein